MCMLSNHCILKTREPFRHKPFRRNEPPNYENLALNPSHSSMALNFTT